MNAPLWARVVKEERLAEFHRKIRPPSAMRLAPYAEDDIDTPKSAYLLRPRGILLYADALPTSENDGIFGAVEEDASHISQPSLSSIHGDACKWRTVRRCARR